MYYVFVSHVDKIVIPFYVERERCIWPYHEATLDDEVVKTIVPELEILLNKDLNKEVLAILSKDAMSISELGKKIQYLEAAQRLFSRQLSKVVLAFLIEWVKANSLDMELNDYDVLCLNDNEYEKEIRYYKKNRYDVILEFK